MDYELLAKQAKAKAETKPKVRGRGGPLTAFISEAGGAGGAALGAQIGGAAGSIVPGAGTLLGAALGAGIGGLAGGFGGKALEQQIRDQQALFGKGGSFKQAAQEGAITGLLSGLSAGASGIRAASKAGISAKEALKMSPKAIQEAKALSQTYKALTGSQRSLADAYNLLPGTKVAGSKPLSIAKSKELLNHVQSISSAVNPEQVLADMENHSKLIGKQIGAIVKTQNRALTVAEKKLFKQEVTDALAGVAGINPNNVTVKNLIKSATSKTDLNGVQAFRQSIQNQLNYVSTAKSAPLEQYREALRKIAVNFIDNNVEGIKDLNKAFSLTSKAIPFLQENLTRNVGVRLPIGLGATNLTIGGRAPVAAKIAGAKAGEKVGGLLGQIGQSPLGLPLKVQAVKGTAGAINQLTQLPEAVTPTGATMPGEMGVPLETGALNMAQTPPPIDPRLPRIAIAIEQDIAKTGGKNIKNIQTIAGLYGIDLTPIGLGTTTKKSTMDAATKRQLAGISSGAGIVDELETLLSQSGGGRGRIAGGLQSLVARTGAAPQVEAFRAARQGYISRLSKALGETGVLTDQDISRARAVVPNITDTPQEVQLKLDSLRRIINDAYNKLQAQFQ